jgi:hypothetical protein
MAPTKGHASITQRADRRTVALLAAHFEACGCIRAPNPARRRAEPRDYKKGWEVRLAATTRRELRFLRQMLRKCGFKCGRAYHKRAGWILPLYGRAAVERFCKLVKAS